MKEIRDIVIAYKCAKEQGQAMALATVVLVVGSSYRRPGARMLVTDDGQLTGAISGGCLEGDALRKALLTISQGKNKLVTYDTTEGNDTALGVQLGCNGIVHILFEPIDASNPDNPIALLGRLLEDRQPGVLITLFDLKLPSGSHPGTCFLFGHNPQQVWSANSMQSPLAPFFDLSQRVFRLETSVFDIIDHSENSLNLFAEWIPPAPRLIVVGAGNDTIPLCRMAALLGWEVIMVDGRASHCSLSRFPQASACRVLKAEEVASKLPFDARTAVLLMTHNYQYDLRILGDLLPRTDLPYIGALGPKSKLEKMYGEIEKAESRTIPSSQKEKLYGPIGLEIGAETSEEISLSVLAEIQAVFSGKTGSSLRNKSRPIHDQSQSTIRY